MDWNDRYLTGNFNDAPAAQLLLDAAKPMIPTRALDVACGAGRNALALAERGWAVTAIDAAEGAIAIVERRAAEAGVKIDTRLLDLERDELPFEDESFDLVAMFHYLDRNLVPRLLRFVAPGGLFVAAIHTTAAEASSRPSNPAFVLEPGEIATWFGEGWEVVTLSDREVAEVVVKRVES